MDYAVISVPAAPVRRKARHQTEMTNQLLFGEKVRVLKEKKGLWVKVRSLHDNYEGWVTRTLLKEVDEKEIRKESGSATTDMLNRVMINGKKMYVPFGSSLPGFANGQGKI